MWWMIGAASNAAIAIAYLAIAWIVLRQPARTAQLRANLLGVATAGVFVTGALHHGLQVASLLQPAGVQPEQALRAWWDWQAVAVDLAAVGAALYYWTLRSLYGSLLQGPKLFE